MTILTGRGGGCRGETNAMEGEHILEEDHDKTISKTVVTRKNGKSVAIKNKAVKNVGEPPLARV